MDDLINKVINGDCLEVMKTIPNKSVNHIICDLPFYGVVKDDWDNQWKNVNDYIDWCRDVIIEYKRILVDNGNIFLFTGRQYNRHIAMILDEFFTEKRIIIWARKRNFNSSRGKALASGYEPICYYCNGEANDAIFNNVKILSDSKRKEYQTGDLKDGITLSDVWNDISALPHNAKEKVDHSTQKPLALIERIINIGTNVGDLILDNCSGSGTLAIACMNLDRNYLCIEREEKYYNITLDRINKKNNG